MIIHGAGKVLVQPTINVPEINIPNFTDTNTPNKGSYSIALVKDALNYGVEWDVFEDRNLHPILMPDFNGKITRIGVWLKKTYSSTAKPNLDFYLYEAPNLVATTPLVITSDATWFWSVPDGHAQFFPRQALLMRSAGGGNLDATEGVVQVYYEEILL